VEIAPKGLLTKDNAKEQQFKENDRAERFLDSIKAPIVWEGPIECH
jgi:hypothetical protein